MAPDGRGERDPLGNEDGRHRCYIGEDVWNKMESHVCHMLCIEASCMRHSLPTLGWFGGSMMVNVGINGIHGGSGYGYVWNIEY